MPLAVALAPSPGAGRTSTTPRVDCTAAARVVSARLRFGRLRIGIVELSQRVPQVLRLLF